MRFSYCHYYQTRAQDFLESRRGFRKLGHKFLTVLRNKIAFRHYYKLLSKISTCWRLCCARDLFGSQIPVTRVGFELRIAVGNFRNAKGAFSH